MMPPKQMRAPVPMPQSAAPPGANLGTKKNFWEDPRFMRFGGEALQDLGYGLSRGTNFGQALGYATQRTQDIQPQRDAYEKTQAEAAERQQKITDAAALKDKYSQFFIDNGRPDVAQGIADGIVEPGAAYMDFIKPKEPTKLEFRDNGQGDILGLDPTTGRSTVAYDGQPERPEPGTGYRWKDDVSQEFIPGGSADPANKGTDLTQAEQRNLQLATVIDPEIKTVEDNWGELTDPKNQMIGANTPAGSPGFAFTSPGYQQATNALQTVIASYLYSVSGATATDAEIKRQMDILTPKFGESKASADQKKARIRVMADAVKAAAGGGMASGGDYEVVGVE